MFKEAVQSQQVSQAGHGVGLSRFLIAGIIAITLTLLMVTLLRFQDSNLTGLARKITLLNVTSENSVGSWWSGILLLLVALHAFDGYQSLRKRQPRVASGWALLSIVMLVLSIDEIASFHERVNQYIYPVQSLLLLGIILAPLLGYALPALWSDESQRPKVRLIAVAFILLATVSFQESLEHRIDWGWALGLRGAVEEGTELLSTIILLAVSMTNSRGRFARKEISRFPTLEVVKLARPYVLWGGLVIAPVLAYFTASLTDQQRGHPADWYAAAVFLLAALMVSRRFYKHGNHMGVTAWTLTGLCVLGSVVSVSGAPLYVTHVGTVDFSSRMIALFVVSILITVAWLLDTGYANTWATRKKEMVAIVALASLALFGLFQTSLFLLYLIPQYMALLVYYASSAVNRGRHTPSGRPLTDPSTI